MLRVHRRQHPAGQGFFHSAIVSVGYGKLHYVYDCGSDNKAALRSRIDDYCADVSARVDVLFVSHLDSDHVNGLDRLLSFVTTETVVLPYLSDADILLILADADSRGMANASLVLFLSDIVGWFGDRGVSRVILVRGNDTDFPDDPPPDLPPAPPAPPENAETVRLNLDALLPNAEQIVHRSTFLGKDVQVLTLNHRIPLLLTVNGQLLNGAFLTFVHPEIDKIKAFRSKVSEVFPDLGPLSLFDRDRTHRELSSILASGERRAKLADCYNHIRKNRNLTSLAMYSGPLGVHPAFSASCRSLAGNRRLSVKSSERCGSIATGDANLRSNARKKAFFRHYSGVLKYVWSVSLPHHGSRHNFADELLNAGPPVYIAAAGKQNKYGHPHNEVLVEVRSRNAEYFVITEEPNTALNEIAEVLGVNNEPAVPVQCWVAGVGPDNALHAMPLELWTQNSVRGLVQGFWMAAVFASRKEWKSDEEFNEALNADENRMPDDLIVLRWDTKERVPDDWRIGQVAAPRAALIVTEDDIGMAGVIKKAVVESPLGQQIAEWLERHMTDPRQSLRYE
jgi:hypothetical protein